MKNQVKYYYCNYWIRITHSSANVNCVKLQSWEVENDNIHMVDNGYKVSVQELNPRRVTKRRDADTAADISKLTYTAFLSPSINTYVSAMCTHLLAEQQSLRVLSRYTQSGSSLQFFTLSRRSSFLITTCCSLSASLYIRFPAVVLTLFNVVLPLQI